MHERYLGRIQPGMDVCDAKGGRLGSVARVYRYDVAELGTSSTVAPALVTTIGEEILEVKRGPLGLGKHLFVPFGMIHEVISDSVFLSVEGFDTELSRFTKRPDYLASLH